MAVFFATFKKSLSSFSVFPYIMESLLTQVFVCFLFGTLHIFGASVGTQHTTSNLGSPSDLDSSFNISFGSSRFHFFSDCLTNGLYGFTNLNIYFGYHSTTYIYSTFYHLSTNPHIFWCVAFLTCSHVSFLCVRRNACGTCETCK